MPERSFLEAWDYGPAFARSRALLAAGTAAVPTSAARRGYVKKRRPPGLHASALFFLSADLLAYCLEAIVIETDEDLLHDAVFADHNGLRDGDDVVFFRNLPV